MISALDSPTIATGTGWEPTPWHATHDSDSGASATTGNSAKNSRRVITRSSGLVFVCAALRVGHPSIASATARPGGVQPRPALESLALPVLLGEHAERPGHKCRKPRCRLRLALLPVAMHRPTPPPVRLPHRRRCAVLMPGAPPDHLDGVHSSARLPSCHPCAMTLHAQPRPRANVDSSRRTAAQALVVALDAAVAAGENGR